MIVTEQVKAVAPYGCRYITHRIHQKGRMTDLDMINLYRKLKATGGYTSVKMYREIKSYTLVDMENYFVPPSELKGGNLGNVETQR